MIERVFNELLRFSPRIITVNPKASFEIIERFEKRFSVELPKDYKELLSFTNGFSLMGSDVLGVFDQPQKWDLFRVYQIEHDEVIIPMPKQFIPFSPDGQGNFYCFDTSKITNTGYSCEVVFWTSNYEYSEMEMPEVTHNSLCEFIEECIIGWTLESFNYDGIPIRSDS